MINNSRRWLARAGRTAAALGVLTGGVEATLAIADGTPASATLHCNSNDGLNFACAGVTSPNSFTLKVSPYAYEVDTDDGFVQSKFSGIQYWSNKNSVTARLTPRSFDAYQSWWVRAYETAPSGDDVYLYE